ncbi:MAG: hypothetical protein LBS45_08775 [Synergistaceae bacterium]|nr:hypothetical protein [Synergistaceae bacterium]
MSRIAKKNIIISFVAASLFICAVVYFILSRSTFYAEIVEQKVGEAFYEAGYSLEVDSLKGNPLTGVEGGGVRISHDGALIARAEAVEIKPRLSSVLSSNPKLSVLAFKKLVVDYDILSDHLPVSSGDSSEPPALEAFALYDSIISTQWGDVELERFYISINDSEYKISYDGKYRGYDASLAASILMSSRSAVVSDLKGKWNGMAFAATGPLTPYVSVDCSITDLDVGKASEIIPSIADAGISGVFDTNFSLTFRESLNVTGALTAESGSIEGILYDGLSAKYAYTDGLLRLTQVKTTLYGAPVSGDARINISEKKPSLSLVFNISSLDPSKMTDRFPWLKGIDSVINSVSCDIRGPADSLSGPIDIYASSVNAFDFDFEKVSARLNLKKTNSLGLSLSCRALRADVRVSGDIAILPAVSTDLGVSISPIDLDLLAAKYREVKNLNASGDVSLTARVKGPADKIRVSGEVFAPSLALSRDIKLREVMSEFEYSNAGLLIKGAKADWEGARFTAAGARVLPLSNAPQNATRNALEFKGSISGLNLASLSMFAPELRDYGIDGVLSAGWSLSGTLENPAVSADFVIPSLVLNKQNLSDVRAVLNYRSGSIDILSASCSYDAANLSASGAVKLPNDTSGAEYNVKGRFSGLDAEPLKRAGIISQDAEISCKLSGDFRLWEDKSGSGARIFFRDSTLRYDNLQFSDINGSAALIDRVLIFERLRSRMNIGNLTINGSVANLPRFGKERTEGISLDKLPMEIKATVSSADIGRISRLFLPDARGYQGFVNCSADLTGTVGNPKFRADGLLYGVRAFGLFLPFIALDSVTGGMDDINIPALRAVVGRGLISADVNFKKSDGEWGGSLRASGRSVDIRSLMGPLDYERKVDVAGSLGFVFSGKGSVSAFEGSGKVVIPNLSVMGAKFTNLEAPFWVTEGYVVVEDSSARAYGGTVSAQIAKDIRMSDWGGTLYVKSADVASAMRDIVPDSEGVVSGSADLRIHIGGDTRRTSTLNGDGNIEIKNGEVSGYSGAEAVSKLLGGKPLRFNSLDASFTVDGKMLYLLPGSRIAAPKGDPVFNYVMADGSISMEKDISLFCVGNVNIRALNSFVGGVRGLVSSAIDEGTSGLTLNNFLGGAITGLAKDEFRDVSLSVKASSSDISIENVVISEPTKNDLTPALNEAERRREKNDETLRLNLEFPVGPGGDGRKEGIGSQVGGQVLQHALNGLLSF